MEVYLPQSSIKFVRPVNICNPTVLWLGLETLVARQICRVHINNAVLFLCADLNVAAAMLALFSLFLMVMGAICITMSLSKEILFFLKPAAVCFILSGESIQNIASSQHVIAWVWRFSWCQHFTFSSIILNTKKWIRTHTLFTDFFFFLFCFF